MKISSSLVDFIKNIHRVDIAVLCVAFIVQALAVYFLMNHQLNNALIFHILSAIAFPWPLLKLMPVKFHNEWPALILFYLLCLFIPLVSGLGLLLSLSISAYFSKPYLGEISNTVKIPELPDQILQTMQLSSYKGGSLLGVLEASPVNDQRIQAVLKTRQMVDKDAIPILKLALLDPVDEVRLLAYSMLDKKEKKIDRLITTQLQRLEEMPSEKHVAEHMSLAESYWELSYLGLVVGQAQTHILQDAYSHIQKVIKYRASDAEAYFLQARIALALNLYDVAESSLDLAVEFELNSSKAIAYREELAFVTRHFEKSGEKKLFNKYENKGMEQHILGETESWG